MIPVGMGGVSPWHNAVVPWSSTMSVPIQYGDRTLSGDMMGWRKEGIPTWWPQQYSNQPWPLNYAAYDGVTGLNSLYHRRDVVEMLMFCKQKKQLTFQQIAQSIGKSETWTTAALLGQATFSPEESEILMELLSVDPKIRHSVKCILTQPPMKGALEGKVPADPVVYRFYEILQVYGTVFKALIHEKFGDGVMSTVDFTIDLDKERRPDGDYVKVNLCGKFLPYKKW